MATGNIQQTTLKINSIFDGISPSQYFGVAGTYNTSIAVDPDLPIISTDIRTSGFCVPVGYAKFSGTNVNGNTVAIITNPKDTNVYVVLSNGKLISYSSSLGSETLIGTVAGSNATGATYYNNYIYIFGTGAGKDDVSRYGPLNNAPSLVDNVWKGVTLGSQSALGNPTYPTIRGVTIPNHWGFVHGDNSLYFCDFGASTSTKPGQGMIHRIHTKKTTDEGDTNDTTVPSLYAALSLPFGFYPTSIVNFGTSVMILGMYTIDSTINQGRSAFVLWDPTNTTSFYLGPVFLEDPLATALLNVNGSVYVWSGNAVNGCRMSRYVGGESVNDIIYLEEGFPPFAGAVDSIGNRIIFGAYTTNPSTSACVFAYGSKDKRLPAGLHNVIKTSSAGASPIVCALKYVQQNSNITPKAITAWHDASANGIDQYSTTATLASKMRWMFNIGRKFNVMNIMVPFAGAVAANTTITPTLYFDDLSSSKVLTVINNTNYPTQRKVQYKGAELINAVGLNNFVFELAWTGTNPLPVALPIEIGIEIKTDEA